VRVVEGRVADAPAVYRTGRVSPVERNLAGERLRRRTPTLRASPRERSPA